MMRDIDQKFLYFTMIIYRQSCTQSCSEQVGFQFSFLYCNWDTKFDFHYKKIVLIIITNAKLTYK